MIVGILIGILLMTNLGFIYCCLNLQKKIEVLEKPKPIKQKKVKPKLTEEQKEKQEKIKKSFDNMMEYGYEQALKASREE